MTSTKIYIFYNSFIYSNNNNINSNKKRNNIIDISSFLINDDLKRKETVQKIIYYIKNKFKIDDELKKYFEYFNFKPGNNVDEFINSLL